MKKTNDLQRELTASPNLSRFLSMNQDQFVDGSFIDILQELLQKSGMSKATPVSYTHLTLPTKA